MIVSRSQAQRGAHDQDGVIEPAFCRQKVDITEQHFRAGWAQCISLPEGKVRFPVQTARFGSSRPIHQPPLIQSGNGHPQFGECLGRKIIC